ncbi:MAG: beta-lactamase family protein [Alphaproteobacteria bacterium]|nr:beta-lactamase family protein [Alphaproteobacteria bacterium]
MIRQTLAAAALLAATSIATPGFAQSEQEQLDARYDRALAAGYKALMLCSAIANAERNGAARTPESVAEWEMAGIQAPLDAIAPELGYRISRVDPGDASSQVANVSVDWAEGMAPRIARHVSQQGCQLLPIGGNIPPFATLREQPNRPSVAIRAFPSGALARISQKAFGDAFGEGARTTAVVVQSGGRMLGEAYARDFGPAVPQRTWSVAKSLAATLVGAAVERGETAVERRAGLGNRTHDQGRAAITIDHLLRMASGRYSDTPGNRTDPLYWGGATVDERAANWPLVNAPGSTYRYANNDTLMAVKAIEGSLADHPPSALFASLGMDHTVAETDWQGNYILSSQVWTTARDLAKFGQLYLDDGVLPDGTRILPEGWVEYVSAPSGPQPEGRPMGYGAGFWLFNRTAGIPSDTIAAMGNRGQYVVIVPSRDVVIVRRGEDPVGESFDILAFTRDVLAALGE